MRKPAKHVARDGKVTWKVRFRSPENRQSSKTFPTERAAKIFCADLDARGPAFALEMATADDETPEEPTLTVDDLLEDFLAWKATRVRSDRTIADYRRDWKNWVSPTFGVTPVNHVTPRAVQDWVDAMHAGTRTRGTTTPPAKPRPCSPKSVADRHALLHGVYKWAVARGLAVDNPTTGTSLVKRRKTPPKGLRPAEWQALRAALADIDADACDLADFLLASGWRWSEATALSVFEVEDDGDTVHVTMGRVVRRNAAGAHVIVEDGKQAASMRRVALDADTARMVRHRVLAAEPGGLVFTTREGSRWHYNNFRSRKWERAVDAAKLSRRPTPHWLRHTHVQWMLTSGAAGLAELQARIGHASITTTVGVYGRLVADVRPEALDAFAQMRTGRTTPKVRAAQRKVRKAARAGTLRAV